MTDEQVIALIEKYQEGKCTEEERANLEMAYVDYSRSRDNITFHQDLWIKQEAGLKLIFKERGSKQKTVKLWHKIAAVAAAVALIVMGTWLYPPAVILNLFQDPNVTAANSDIAPGAVGATLTLANGKTIKLSDATNGKLAKEAGVTIKKTKDGEITYEISSVELAQAGEITNILSTAKGETYQVKLPDGTAIWLNAASSLRYPASFNKRKYRSVELSGEAYFQVAKDKAHPFIVESEGQQVEVLGTHFNISSYADEAVTRTSLEEGSVRVTAGNRKSMIKPGEQSVLSKHGLSVSPANLEENLAWKNGYFRFNAENIESIMRKISRWYNIEVVYQGNMPSSGLYGTVSRSKNISQVLMVLELTKLVHFRIEGRKVYVIAN